jgi:hypothetical protein
VKPRVEERLLQRNVLRLMSADGGG